MPDFLPSELFQKFLPLADDAGNLIAKGVSATSPAVVSPAQPNLQQTLVQRAMARDAGQTIGAKDPRTVDVALPKEDPFSSPDFLTHTLHEAVDPGNWTGVGEVAEAAPVLAGVRKLLPAALDEAGPVAHMAEHGAPSKALFEYPHPSPPAPPPIGSAPTPGGWDSYDEDAMWHAWGEGLLNQGTKGPTSALAPTNALKQSHPTSAGDDLKTIGEYVASKGANNLLNYGLPTTPSVPAAPTGPTPDLHQVLLQKRLQAMHALTPPPRQILANEQIRPDGSQKGPGFLGTFPVPGGEMGEYSIANSPQIHGDYPSIVPTTNASELNQILNQHVPASAAHKALVSALARQKAGQPVFAQEGEQRPDLMPYFNRVP